MSAPQSVQCFGKKKTATAVAHCKVSRLSRTHTESYKIGMRKLTTLCDNRKAKASSRSTADLFLSSNLRSSASRYESYCTRLESDRDQASSLPRYSKRLYHIFPTQLLVLTFSLPPALGLRTPPHPWTREVFRSRHPRARYRWWSHVPNLCHPPGHRQVHRGILPEIRRRVHQEPAEASARPVRPNPACCGQQTM